MFENYIIYDLQLGFRQKFYTFHGLINFPENVSQALDESMEIKIYWMRYISGLLQKAFDTVDHEILLSKLDYYGTRSTSNNWFKTYLSNWKQFVSINGYGSGFAEINCGVSQGSVPGDLFYFYYTQIISIKQ